MLIILMLCCRLLQCEDILHQLSKALERIEQSSQDMNEKMTSEEQSLDEQNEKETEHNKLASILSTEQERTREIAEECNALKCSLETVQNRNELLDNEAKGKKQEVEQLRQQIKRLRSKFVESKQAYDLSKEQLEQEKKKYEKLAIELKEMKSTESRSRGREEAMEGEIAFEEEKKQLLEQLREISALRWKKV